MRANARRFANVTKLLLAAVLCGGCSGRPSPLRPPTYASGAGDAAVKELDTNADGALAKEELAKAPSLLSALAQIDGDADGRITAGELNARVQTWIKSQTGRMSAPCSVLLDGAPLAGAKVEFVPEKWLGSGLASASGTTSDDGMAVMVYDSEASKPERLGISCGWYRVRVSHPTANLPAIYTDGSALGCEVAPDADWMYEAGSIVFQLQRTPSN